MTWAGPGFVDHHVHLLRVAAGERTVDADPYTPKKTVADERFAEQVAAHHRRLLAEGTTPMDRLDPVPAAGDDLADRLHHGLTRAAELGLVEVTETGMAGWEYYDALQRLRERGPLPVRVKLFAASAIATPAMPRGPSADLQVVGVKFYADGWLGPRTCAVGHPFDDRPDDTGILFQDADALASRIEPFAEAGFSVATHAIGDRAIEAVLDGYEKVYGAGCREAAPRIEHAQLLRPDLIDRIAELGAVVCIQPSFAVSDAPSRRAGLGDRWPAAYRWDQLIAAGARVIAGSDFPIETLSPLWNLQRLVTGADIESDDVVAEPLAVDVALGLMTDSAAGTTMLSADPTAVEPTEIHALTVERVESALAGAP